MVTISSYSDFQRAIILETGDIILHGSLYVHLAR